MKILFDNRWFGSHGIGRFAQEVYCRLKSDFQFIFFKKNTNPASPMSPFFDSFKLFSSKADGYFSPGYNPLFCSNKPFVFTIHDLTHIKFSQYSTILKRLYYNFLVKRAAKKAFKVLTVSKFSKKEIVDWANVDPDKVVVCYNGVGDCFEPYGEKHKLNFPYFLFVGNLKPHKNVCGLLKAFANFHAVNPNVYLVISGNCNNEYKLLIAQLNLQQCVQFTGDITDEQLAAYYRGAIALVLISYYEGFGLPIVEAMACGTPVIASNVTAMPEIAGGAAILVDPDNQDEVVIAMETIMNNKPKRSIYVNKGLKRAKAFTWKKTGNIVGEVIVGLINSEAK